MARRLLSRLGGSELLSSYPIASLLKSPEKCCCRLKYCPFFCHSSSDLIIEGIAGRTLDSGYTDFCLLLSVFFCLVDLLNFTFSTFEVCTDRWVCFHKASGYKSERGCHIFGLKAERSVEHWERESNKHAFSVVLGWEIFKRRPCLSGLSFLRLSKAVGTAFVSESFVLYASNRHSFLY